jgi:hypothetical protein
MKFLDEIKFSRPSPKSVNFENFVRNFDDFFSLCTKVFAGESSHFDTNRGNVSGCCIPLGDAVVGTFVLLGLRLKTLKCCGLYRFVRV